MSKQMASAGAQPAVIRLKPYFYIHVLDNNSNVARLEIGPQTFVRQDHQSVILGPEQMVTVPPRFYCVISNPVIRDEKGELKLDKHGGVRIKHGDKEIRFSQDPFPLYHGEQLVGSVAPLQVVGPEEALRLKAIRDFKDEKSERWAGDEWLYEGPGTYLPRIEVKVVEMIKSIVIQPNSGLLLKARRACTDRSGQPRKAGELFMIRKEGSYLPAVDEEVVRTVKAVILTEKKALHLRATRTEKDVFEKQRLAGEEWVVTMTDCESYIPDVYEEIVGEVRITTLNNRQFCVVLDPHIGGKTKLGARELRIGEASFFLQPGERLEAGLQPIWILGDDEALLLKAREQFEDKDVEPHVKHVPGDRWMIYGPREYVPPVHVEIVDKRVAIPLDENEGIYVRDIKSGRVRMVCGEAYMLKPNEELWEKELPEVVENLLMGDFDPSSDRGDHGKSQVAPSKVRDKTRVVTFRAPHNSAVQVYDYKSKMSRVVFGPDLVMLGPDEQFTILSLSGGKPKRPHVIKTLALLLGPDFMTDIIRVETSDHARLSLQLSYNWAFAVDRELPTKIFQVPDFVGDACKAIASRVRGKVAGVTFDDFHRNSAKVIRLAVFGGSGSDGIGKVNDQFRFNTNNLVITNIDIQTVEPVDQRTRDSLQKSVQLAIEITTSSQEASARHNAQRVEQEAKGLLERQQIHDQAAAEDARRGLLQLQAQSAAVESTGQSTAEAKARAEAELIEAQSAVNQAEMKSKAMSIQTSAELEQLKQKQAADIDYQTQLNALEIEKAERMAKLETDKFKHMVEAIGADTIRAMAQAGPELQAKLLSGLGLQSVMLTDGKSPINLFGTAQQLIAPHVEHPME